VYGVAEQWYRLVLGGQGSAEQAAQSRAAPPRDSSMATRATRPIIAARPFCVSAEGVKGPRERLSAVARGKREATARNRAARPTAAIMSSKGVEAVCQWEQYTEGPDGHWPGQEARQQCQLARQLLTNGLLGCLGQHALAGGHLGGGCCHKAKHGQAPVDGLRGLRGQGGEGGAGRQALLTETAGGKQRALLPACLPGWLAGWQPSRVPATC
jgi:hypothetical protein